MISGIVGQLKTAEYDSDFNESEPFSIPYFNGQEIKIIFIESNDQYLIEADKVLDRFLKLKEQNRLNDSRLVFEYYNAVLKAGYTEPLELNSVNDIWNYVFPGEVILHWDEQGQFYVCVLCECTWEEEHGLQLVFKNGQKLTRASGHDGDFESNENDE